MDKELSVPQIWTALLLSLLITFLFAAIWRWLLPLSLFAGFCSGAGFAWTEWFTPDVGPAIRHEAGTNYGIHANMAVALLLLVHILFWFLSAKYSAASRIRRVQDNTPLAISKQNLIFAISIFAVTIVATTMGFRVTCYIWVSPPIFVAAIFLGWAIYRYGKVRNE